MSDTHVTLQDFYQKHLKLAENDIVLDVRGADEFKEAHIDKALNIPVTEVHLHLDKLKTYDHVYIHCKRGGRAKTAFEILKNAGLTNIICIHDAGMDHWIESGYPTNKG